MDSSIEDELCDITLSLYHQQLTPRSSVQFIFDRIHSFTTQTLRAHVIKEIEDEISDSSTKEEVLKALNRAFDAAESCFENLKTEYRRFHFYESKGLFQLPLNLEIGDRYIEK